MYQIIRITSIQFGQEIHAHYSLSEISPQKAVQIVRRSNPGFKVQYIATVN